MPKYKDNTAEIFPEKIKKNIIDLISRGE